MTIREISEKLSLEIACEGDDLEREVTKVYCCDLLSIVMGRAPADSAWVTVMGNVNAVAVAVLCDVSCIVVAERMECDAQMLQKAEMQGVTVLKSQQPIYETATAIGQLL